MIELSYIQTIEDACATTSHEKITQVFEDMPTLLGAYSDLRRGDFGSVFFHHFTVTILGVEVLDDMIGGI